MERHPNNNLIPGFVIIFFLFQIAAAGQLEYSTADRNVNSRSLQEQPGDDTGSGDAFPLGLKIDCDFACARRCLKASRQNVCARACGTCCLKCQCVPVGTSGNKQMCPCYANLRTHGRKPKCP